MNGNDEYIKWYHVDDDQYGEVNVEYEVSVQGSELHGTVHHAFNRNSISNATNKKIIVKLENEIKNELADAINNP